MKGFGIPESGVRVAVWAEGGSQETETEMSDVGAVQRLHSQGSEREAGVEKLTELEERS